MESFFLLLDFGKYALHFYFLGLPLSSYSWLWIFLYSNITVNISLTHFTTLPVMKQTKRSYWKRVKVINIFPLSRLVCIPWLPLVHYPCWYIFLQKSFKWGPTYGKLTTCSLFENTFFPFLFSFYLNIYFGTMFLDCQLLLLINLNMLLHFLWSQRSLLLIQLFFIYNPLVQSINFKIVLFILEFLQLHSKLSEYVFIYPQRWLLYHVTTFFFKCNNFIISVQIFFSHYFL